MRPFGDLEAAIMAELWDRGQPATVRDVLAALNGTRSLAYITVMTVMDNLHRKGQLGREMTGRAWLYRPIRTRAEHAAALLQDVLADAGDRQAALIHFVADLDSDSVSQLRSAVEAARRRENQTRGDTA
ncbi:Predicted transcriptional regulator [Blastococcus aurantiacus]|uniref:Predicted transcriptional regulator n=1 Tax=Blastococcus aurantiacus TaxID=1550231 RepID=A0A1G7RB10_9ACTN|nr:Predicted transcriptional regulator [Blastococcus aurantiacus]